MFCSQLELSALQSVVASQEEELQVQASDVESLTRSNQIKEELIKVGLPTQVSISPPLSLRTTMLITRSFWCSAYFTNNPVFTFTKMSVFLIPDEGKLQNL